MYNGLLREKMENEGSFCSSDFYDVQTAWNTTDPDLTPCFQKTVVLWTPSAVLLLVTPFRVFYYSRSKSIPIPFTVLNILKTVVAVCIALIQVANIAKSLQEFTEQQFVPTVDFVSPLVLCLTMVLVVLVLHHERRHGVKSSGLMCVFWLLCVVANVIVCQSKIRTALNEIDDAFRFITSFFTFTLVCGQFILTFFVDKTKEPYSPTEESKEPCPEQDASFWSKLTFTWYTRTVMKGYKNSLEWKDLFQLNPSETCEEVMPHFEKYWQLEVEKEKRLNRIVETPTLDGIEMKTRHQNGDVYTAVRDGKSHVYKKRLYVSLFRAFWPMLLLSAFYRLIVSLLQFSGPLVLKLMIQFTENKEYVWRGYFYAVVIFVLFTVRSILFHLHVYTCQVVGMKVRVSIIGTVYKKMLSMSNAARKSSTVGEMVNLMAVDAHRFLDFAMCGHILWSAPLDIIVALYLLWQVLGISNLAGIGVMALVIPMNVVICRKTRALQTKQMKFKDTRIKLMNEILNGIKVLKLYAWEKSYEKQVLDIRNKELQVIKQKAVLDAVLTCSWIITPFVMNLLTFMTYVWIDDNNILDAEKVFVALALFNIMRNPMGRLPGHIASLIPLSVSLKRLQKFVNNQEIDPTAINRDTSTKHAISIDKGTFVWDTEKEEILKSINLQIPEGTLVAVVGTVGSGKSSLLSAIMGEMDKVNGIVNLKGSVAYVAQQAWIQNATLQENILFGSPMNREKYNKVIEACALGADLDMLPGGDATEIGEKASFKHNIDLQVDGLELAPLPRIDTSKCTIYVTNISRLWRLKDACQGINLSGGQKQRVSLARAVYQDPDIYLLDDPLSAVDSHVGKHIFEQVVGPTGFLKDKTRVLVTHGISFLPKVDMIVVLVDGRISEIGTFKELLGHNGSFSEFLTNYLNEDLDDQQKQDLNYLEDIKVKEDIVSQLGSVIRDEDMTKLQRQLNKISDCIGSVSELSIKHNALGRPLSGSSSSWKGSKIFDSVRPPLLGQMYRSVEEQEMESLKKQVEEKQNDDKLIQEETMETGKVKRSVYLAYIRSVGPLICLIFVFFTVACNVTILGANLWLKEWSGDNATSHNGTRDTALRDLRLGVYGSLGIGQGLFAMLIEVVKAYGAVKATRKLHRLLLENILRSPMSFFDTTPTGRVINRFAKDVDSIDSTVPNIFRQLLYEVTVMICTIIAISLGTPLFLITILPLTGIYYLIQKIYIVTARQLKRLDSTYRSPIFSHFGETISGVSTIRAYGQQERFIKDSWRRVNEHNVCYYPSIIGFRWVAMRMEFLANCIIVFFAMIAAVVGRDSLSAGLVGLSIVYALNVTDVLNWIVRIYADLEANIVSVERVKEYAEFPREADWDKNNIQLSREWPDKGAVEFKDYGTRYREGLDLVLKGISCKIMPGEKIGIVGRTGAGKSSLTMALFRIIEKAMGSIIIDGLDISTLGLHDLRSKLTIIPQEPVLFSGTLRINLDPLSTHTDDELWKAIEHAHLKDFVSGLPEGLQHVCAEGGENLSVGQRQLICLGRALLRKTKVLVLDEATASVDLEMDDLIQNTIRTEFADCTILTIAHRLNTLMDYTRIMVLEAGEIKEFDTPQNLLADSSSTFYGLAKDAGLVN